MSMGTQRHTLEHGSMVKEFKKDLLQFHLQTMSINILTSHIEDIVHDINLNIIGDFVTIKSSKAITGIESLLKMSQNRKFLISISPFNSLKKLLTLN
ncbi:CLUMA_CG000984, isoform A [Clunio marinus]|uniref:CLUMA_CG000984, isoform A n=1 Tax=Clunio marinus TaxID=568069 RepID=A0A1J1HGN3_9DIPT|nr:CLUMA_CG000984, isoform A [Clunio marinus]